MKLKRLLTTSNLTVSYDTTNQWLYLDWHGDLTLDLVRSSCLKVARCFLFRRYKRILNDNSNVTSITSDASPWLATEYLPYMRLAGIEYMAWVRSPNASSQSIAEAALRKLTAPVVVLVDDLATAYDWLSGVHFQSPVMLQPITLSIEQSQAELENRIEFLSNSPAQ